MPFGVVWQEEEAEEAAAEGAEEASWCLWSSQSHAHHHRHDQPPGYCYHGLYHRLTPELANPSRYPSL